MNGTIKPTLAVPLLAPLAELCGAEKDKPNIIVILTDDHGWADLGVQGVEAHIRTPSVDRLARNGVRFQRDYVTAPDGSLPFRLHMSDTAQIGGKGGPMEVTKRDCELTAGVLYQKQPSPFPQTQAANPSASRDPVVGVPVTVEVRPTAYKKVISQVGALRLDVDAAKPCWPCEV